ncbi:MAG: tetratricopeptide repeat protein [Planctomycetota bacterium]
MANDNNARWKGQTLCGEPPFAGSFRHAFMLAEFGSCGRASVGGRSISRSRLSTSTPCIPPFPLGLLVTVGIWAAVGCGALPNTNNAAGVRLYQQGQYAAAMQQFQQALLAEPRNADAYYNLAASYHRVGAAQQDRQSLNQAENLYNQCLDRDENHTDCHRGLAVLLVETERSDRAFALMQNWAARNPRSAEARVELARLYEEFGDAETAKNNLQTAVQLDQANSRAWAALGRLRERAGDPAQALANYQRSLQLNRQQPAIAERVAFLQARMPTGFYGTTAGPAMAAAPAAPMPNASWPAVPASAATAGPNGGTNPRTVQGLPVPPRY